MALLDRIADASTPRVRPDAVFAPGELVRADPVTMEEFGYLLANGSGNGTRTKAGASIGPKRALGITAWYSGVRYLAESIAGLPWHHYVKQGDNDRERRPPMPWQERPDVELPWYAFIESVVMALLHKGNAFAFKLRNLAEQVVGLRELHPDRITVGRGPDGTKRFLVDRDPTVYSTREILHIPGLCYDGRVGLNPIQTFADALGTVAAADDYAAAWYGQNTHVGGLISVPQALSPAEAERLRVEWDEFHAGLLNAHRTGVLSKGATYTRVTLSAADAQLLEARQYGVTEVARMLRIPPHKLYDLTRATFSNIEHQSIEAITDSIQPIVERIEAWLNFDEHLIAMEGHYIEASLEGRLRGDSATRAALYASGITNGWLMPSTAARLENQPAPPELDYYLRPLNSAVIRPGFGEELPDDGGNEAA